MSGRPSQVNLAARAATAERRRAATRERLLDAAEAVVLEQGPSASIEDFVRAAGVSRGTFYNYFPTTADLLHAMNTRVAALVDAKLDALSGIEDAAALLAASLHTVLAAFPADPLRGWLALQLAASRAPRQQPLEARFGAIYAQAVEQGRFHVVEMTAAWTLTFGALRMAQRDVAAGATLPVQSVQVVALILVAFGLPLAEAEAISRTEAMAARSL